MMLHPPLSTHARGFTSTAVALSLSTAESSFSRSTRTFTIRPKQMKYPCLVPLSYILQLDGEPLNRHFAESRHNQLRKPGQGLRKAGFRCSSNCLLRRLSRRSGRATTREIGHSCR